MSNLIINGITYTQKQPSYAIKESLTNELHSCIVIISQATKPTFKRYDIAEFEDKQWLVSAISKVRQGSMYHTTVTLVELTYILEKYILSPCSFTNANDYLKQQIEKALYKVEPLRVDELPRFRLSQTLIDFLVPASYPAKPGEDFVYSERMNLREIIDDMLSAYGVRCYVESINADFTDIVIGYLDLNKKSSDIKTVYNLTSEEETESSEIYADEFDISVQNTQSKNKIEIKHEWQTMKPVNAVTVDDTNLKLIVDMGIEEIVSCKMKFKVTTVEYVKPGTEPESERIMRLDDINVTLDMTELLIEQELYDALPIKGEGEYKGQEDLIPYQRGTNIIGVNETYKPLFFTYSKLSTYVNSKMDPPDTSQPVKDYLEQNNLPYESILTIFGFPSTPSSLQNSALFQVKYNPYIDFHFKQTKDTKNINKKITSVLNQTDRSVDVDRFSKSIRSLANLAGNKQLVKDVLVNSKSELLDLGDRIADNYSLVSREYNVFKEKVKCRYVFIQHFQTNVSSRFSRERRLYNIPNENLVNRRILIKDKLLLSTVPINTYDNNSHLTNATLTYLINSFDLLNAEDKGAINRLLIQTIDRNNIVYPENTYYALNFVGRVIGKSIIWQTKMQDNFSVGLSTGKRIIGGRELHLNNYVDANGEAETISFRFINSNLENLSFADQLIIGNSLPLIPSEYLEATSKKPYIKGSQFSLQPSLFNYILKKDRLETLENIAYQLEANGIDSSIIIGPIFMRYIKLLENRMTDELYIWESPNSGGLYEHGDFKCKGNRLEFKPTISIATNSRIYNEYSLLTNKFAWAIGTADGRLLLAVNNNKQNINSVYFGISRN